ncbi:MAG: GGDEF domain-containing protein [Proteobacteria bacterium]|nr:GGDEF domain-containing protein [Pseudomonadota bacterium]
MANLILKHIEDITRQRDVNLLDSSITRALIQLIQPRFVRVFQLYNRETGLAAVTTAWSDGDHVQSLADIPTDSDFEAVENLPGLKKCLEAAGAFSERDSQTRAYHHWLPVYMRGSPYASVEIVSERQLTISNRGMVEGIMGVYLNFLSLLEDSQRDGLTGLANRKAFDRSLRRLLTTVAAQDASENERRQATGRESWLAIIDVDHFKTVNDCHGHLMGDKVLIQLADIMRRSFRVQDRIFRFGGDEFVILIRQTDSRHVATSLERFRANAEGHAFDSRIGRITVSAGYAKITSNDTPTTIIGHADSSHYYAKKHGRNRVCSYDQLLAERMLE